VQVAGRDEQRRGDGPRRERRVGEVGVDVAVFLDLVDPG
jgi:hypothetical protein